jgi:hypothetical protein
MRPLVGASFSTSRREDFTGTKCCDPGRGNNAFHPSGPHTLSLVHVEPPLRPTSEPARGAPSDTDWTISCSGSTELFDHAAPNRVRVGDRLATTALWVWDDALSHRDR